MLKACDWTTWKLQLARQPLSLFFFFFVCVCVCAHLAAKTERNFNGYSPKWCGIWNQSQDFKLMLSLQVRLGQTREKRLENIGFDVER